MDVTTCRVLKLYYVGYAEVIEADGASQKILMSFTMRDKILSQRRNDKALDALLLEGGSTSLKAPSLKTPTKPLKLINL